MTDRELLEAAAKAAGYDLYAAWTEFGYFDGYRIGSLSGDVWNPLDDDGDALRLAVQLKIGLHWMNGRVCAYQNAGLDDQFESSREDAQANTRRAIVRAAAALAVSDLAKMEGAP